MVPSGKYTPMRIYRVVILFCLLKFTINLFSITTVLLIRLVSAPLLSPYLSLTRAPEEKHLSQHLKLGANQLTSCQQPVENLSATHPQPTITRCQCKAVGAQPRHFTKLSTTGCDKPPASPLRTGRCCGEMRSPNSPALKQKIAKAVYTREPLFSFHRYLCPD